MAKSSSKRLESCKTHFYLVSYAKGTANEDSDIDLLIISKELPQNKPKGTNGFYLTKLAGFENIYLGLKVISIHPEKFKHPITKSFFFSSQAQAPQKAKQLNHFSLVYFAHRKLVFF